jgi:uncharacterized Zn finger protein
VVEGAGLAGPWWASRWISVLEYLGLASRLERGRRYARAGRVLRLEIEAGRVEALVQGTRYEPYRVRLRLKKLTDRQWDKAIGALASRAKFSARLLAGDMPDDIEDAFEAAGLTLFPSSGRELSTSCTCPDAANPCKHSAAVHFILAEQLDQDPFLLFHLRGRSREQILRALRARRAAEAAGHSVGPSKPGPVSADVDRFWVAGESLDSITVTVGPPKVSAALLKRLGVPAFWKPHPEIRGALERLYAKVTERSMALAYGGEGSETLRQKRRR